jgi:hypothetical protein
MESIYIMCLRRIFTPSHHPDFAWGAINASASRLFRFPLAQGSRDQLG